jgi:hypothetical protein
VTFQIIFSYDTPSHTCLTHEPNLIKPTSLPQLHNFVTTGHGGSGKQKIASKTPGLASFVAVLVSFSSADARKQNLFRWAALLRQSE